MPIETLDLVVHATPMEGFGPDGPDPKSVVALAIHVGGSAHPMLTAITSLRGLNDTIDTLAYGISLAAKLPITKPIEVRLNAIPPLVEGPTDAWREWLGDDKGTPDT